MTVGTQVRVLHSMFRGLEAPIIKIIDCEHTDVRYDVEGTHNRWYYACELEVIANSSKEEVHDDQVASTPH